MKKIACLLFGALAAPFSALFCYASDTQAQEGSLLQTIGKNFWYILLVLAFGAGLFLISRWSQRINRRDQELERERLEFEKQQEEAAQNEDLQSEEASDHDPKEGREDACVEDADPEN